MAIGDTYASLSELKEYASITSDANSLRLLDALDAASRGIERVTYRQYNRNASVSARSISAFQTMSPGLVYVDDFATDVGLIVATDEDADGAYEITWSAADYQLEPLDTVVDGVPGWPYTRIRAVGISGRKFPRTTSGRAVVKVTADWGWLEVPGPVKSACLIVAQEIYKMKDAPFGVAGFGEYGQLRVRENPVAMKMLAPYVRTPVWVG